MSLPACQKADQPRPSTTLLPTALSSTHLAASAGVTTATPASAPVASGAASAAPAPSSEPPGTHHAFGDPIAVTKSTNLGRLLAHPDAFADKTVLVEGLVRRACTRRGCWMELAPAQDGPGCRVTFKNYGFFVPTDSAGSHARVEAIVKQAVLSPGEVAHHQREGAQFASLNRDGSANETRLIANGVELWR
ncbi:MAG TPA: DUF4920 domain-containing protein [Polyangiaceae bacterium]|nr:DUF4920 domain-containing protein [Polyangiaceae bacterium]